MTDHPLFSRIRFLPSARAAALALALLAAPGLHAATYYWDNNDSTAGFGTAGGTWAAPTTNDATQGWSTSSAGTNTLSGTTTTTTSDDLFFGTSTVGLAAGTITVSGNVSSRAITFGSASGAITLSGGNITLAGDIAPSAGTTTVYTITSNITLSGNRKFGVHQRDNRFVFSGVISGSSSLTTSGRTESTVAITGMNTFTGNFTNERGQLSFNSIANAGQNSALGAGSKISFGLSGAQGIVFWYTGEDSASSNRTWENLGANSLIFIAQKGSLQLAGNFTYTPTSNLPITLAGTADTGINEISGNISDAAGAGLTSLTISNNGPSGGVAEAGFWILSGNNSYEGATTVANSSRLRISHANALGTTAAGTTVQNGSVLELAGGISVGAEALSIQGTGISSGGALRNISGNNSYGGVITLVGATRINSDSDLLTLSSAISGAQNLTIGGAGNTTVSGNITTSTGTLTKDGAGTLTISGTGNTYSGATTISAGTLAVSGNLSSSAITIASGATLNGAGTVGTVAVNGTMDGTLSAGAITLNSGGIITPNTNESVGTISSSSITINGGGYNWTLSSANGSAGTGYDQITSTGALTTSGLLTVYAYGTPGDWDGSANYSWDIFSAASLSGAFDSTKFVVNLDNFGIAVGNRTGTWSFSNPSGGNITLSYTAATDPVWTGGTGNFSTGFTPTASNGDDIAFSGAGGTATNNNWLTSVNDLVFRAGAGSYTIEGTALTVNGSITNSATNTQTINMGVAAGSIINSGTLEIGASGRLNSGSYSNTITNSGSLIYSGTNDQTLSGSISGLGAVEKNAASTLTLSGSNSYSGATTINAGALRATHANALGSTAAGTTVASGAALELSGGISIGAEALTLSGTGISEGGALRNISGDNTYAGLITLGAATRINSDSGNLTISNAGTITGNGLGLTIGGSGNTSITSIIGTGAGTLTKDGTGRLTLSGANTYTGATTINAGTLATSSANRLSDSTNITVNSGGMLSLGGADTVGTLSGAGAISIGANTLTTNSSSSATFSGNITGTTGGFTKSGSGTQTLSGSANSWNGTTSISTGTLTLSGNLSTTGSVAINGAAGPVLNITGNLTKSGGSDRGFQIAASSGTTATVNVSGSGILTLGAGMFFGENSGGNGTMNVTGGTVTPNGAVWFAGANSTLNVSGGTFNNGNNIIRLGGGSGTTISTLSVSGSGTVIGGDLNFGIGGAGATTIVNLGDGTTGGNLSITGMSYTNGPSHTINFNGATLNVRSNSSMITTNTTTVVKAGGAVIDVNAGQTFTISNNLTTDGGGGGLTKNGTGTLILSGAGNNYTGTTTVNAGTLTLNNGSAIADTVAVSVSSGAVLNLSASETVGSIAGAGNITLGANTLTSGGDNSSTTLTGLISGAGGGLTKNGTGTLSVPMASTYTGTTTVNGGTLRIENLTTNGGSDLKETPGSVFNINNSSTLVLHSDVGGNNRVTSNNDTFTFGSNGGGTLEWSKANFLLQGGFIHQFTTTGGLQNIITTTNGAYLNGQTAATANFTVADGSDAVDLLVSGSLNNILITKNGTGTMSITTTTTGSYAITIQEGTLDIGGSATLAGGTYSATLTNNGTFSYSSSAAQTLSGIITGTGSLTKNGSGTLTLTNASNDYSGGTTLNTGTLVIGNAAAAGTGTITQTDGTSVLKFDTTGTIANAMSIYNVVSNQTVTLSGAITAQNTTYDVATGTTLSINGSIGGTGGVTKDGDGTLELNAANTFTGATVVNAGTLEANATGSLGSTTNITVNGGSLLVGANNAINDSAAMDLAGGTLEFNGNINETVGALTLSANSVIDMGGGNVALEFSNLVTQLTSTTRLNIYNYTLYSDHLSFGSNTNLSDSLPYISFYSGFGTGFIGNSFIEGINPYEIRPVPEPETWATAAILLIGGGIYLVRRKKQTA